MDSKMDSFMDLMIKAALLFNMLFFMAIEGVDVQSDVARSLVKANELEKCEAGLGAKCGKLIYGHVFEGGEEVPQECCGRLVSVGKYCHDLITEVTIVYKRLPEKKARKIWKKNDKTWENCKDSVSPGRSGSDEYEKCKSGLGIKCGHAIYQNVFESGSQVSGECCGRLFKAGKNCHDLITEITIVYKRLTEKQAREIWNKNDEVWEQCAE